MRGTISGLLVSAVAVALAHSAQADISISKQPTQNMTCNAGLCTPTAKDAVLNVTDLTNMLSTADLTVQTGNGNNTAAGIDIIDGFSWTSVSRLTLTAKHNITVKAPVTVAGQGALTLTYGSGNAASDLLFEKNGKINFWDTSSLLAINGKSYHLFSNISSLQSLVRNTRHGKFLSYAMAADYDASHDNTYQKFALRSFSGILEGFGHTISNLTIKGYGFVGYSLATIRDLNFVNELIEGHEDGDGGGLVGNNAGIIFDVNVKASFVRTTATYAGGLAGRNYGTILQCKSSGSVAGENAGGLVGYSGGSISDSSSSAVITSIHRQGEADSAGGLVGYNDGSIYGRASISNSHASGSVHGVEFAGGLVGVDLGTITASSADGDVTGDEAGGLVGYGALIDQSFANGSVSAGSGGGGLIGSLSDGSSVTNSYATGSVGGADAGGLSGESTRAIISGSYSVGAVDGTTKGGFLGHDYGNEAALSANYWDLDTSGVNDPGAGCGDVPNCSGVTGLSDAQMKSGLPAGFDPKIWSQSPNINNGYPYLLANPPPQ